MKTKNSFFLSERFLSKVPLLLLFGIFALPFATFYINYYLGLYFIAFYVSYWTIRAFESYLYVIFSYIKLLKTNKKDYINTPEIKKQAQSIKHIIIVPFYSEPYEIIEETVNAIVKNDYPYKNNITILLAPEERKPETLKTAELILKKFAKNNVNIVSISHPDWLPEEWKVKWANITYAIKKFQDDNKFDEHKTFVHSIDADTKVEKNFFLITTYVFLTAEKRDNAIYQYTPVYSNNWTKWTFFARIIAMGTTFWQLSESQNPEFYRNFAVYGQSLYCLKKSDYWSKTSIVEDWFQYWRSYFAFDGVFRIINVPAVCHMDVVEEVNLWKTIKAQYKQLRRWSWWCSDVEFVIPNFIRNKKIGFWEKLRKIVYLAINHAFWAWGSIMLFIIWYFPWIFDSFRNNIATLAVPLSTSIIFTWIFATIAVPSVVSVLIMKKYAPFRKRDYLLNIFQWITIPILALTIFSIPAIESQIRLFFGKRIDSFEVTKKMRK